MLSKKKLLSVSISALAMVGFSLTAHSQVAQENDAPITVEEVVVLGKLKSAADDVVVERMESEVIADIIDAETIGRIGDSNVASALRRLPGVTLIDDQYVFVRGLGERYSSALLNGAVVPSPDLTRSVLPLDIFPTSILKSIAVQKGYAANMPAAFSGGLIDIRTKGIPEDFVFTMEVGTSHNSETTGDVLSYSGGSNDGFGQDDGTRALSANLSAAINRYQGSLDSLDILDDLNLEGNGNASLGDAEAINRQLALELNRNVDIQPQSRDMNSSFDLSLGNNFYFENGMELGALVGAAYDNSWSNKASRESAFSAPEEIFSEKAESTHNVSITGNLAMGWRWYDDHSIQATSLLLRNTDDKSTIRDYYGSSTLFSEGRGNRDYTVRYEERELRVDQVNGSHRFGGVTRDLIGLNETTFEWLDDLTVKWFYSDATVTTEIPNEVRVTYQTDVDGAGNILSKNIQASNSAGDFRFTNLDDKVENYGWDAELPLYFDDVELTFQGGYNYVRKSRIYQQTQLSLGTNNLTVARQGTGSVSDIFSDANLLNADNGFELDVVGSNGESYLAAVTNTAVFGAVDLRLGESWRFNVGARWEDYQQVGLPWDPLEYEDCQISCDPDELAKSVFKDDDYYSSVAITYFRPNFWAEDFQLRFNYSETLVRPDLREITPSSYIDPITGAFVSGNENVAPASVTNIDLRAEWFFSSGDSFTASVFYKDIENPIEFFESAAFEDALAAEIVNAESAELSGLELEFLQNLSVISPELEAFFITGNVTFLDTELIAGANADAPTNLVRPLAGASEYAANLQLGFDSNDGKHAAMLIYNVFGERLYLAGRNGTPDAYEQPFHSVDATYFWYPTEQVTVKLKLKNLLNEAVEIEQAGVTSFTQKPGMGISLDLRYSF